MVLELKIVRTSAEERRRRRLRSSGSDDFGCLNEGASVLHSSDAIRLRRSSLALDSDRLVGALDSGRLMGDFLRSYPSAWGRAPSFAEVLVRPLSVSCQATFVARKAPLDSSPIGRLAATRPGTTMVPGRHRSCIPTFSRVHHAMTLSREACLSVTADQALPPWLG
jgi:hypothetical protein